jgi:hypothetical protein
MRLVRLRLVACAALVALALAAAAPATAQVRGTGHLAFGLGIPQGEFSDNLDGLGYGVHGFLGAASDGSPFVVGLDFGYFIYGINRDEAPLSTTVPDASVDVRTTNSFLQPHLVVRLQPVLGPTRPYIEGLGGFKYLFTQTRVSSDIGRGEESEITTSTNFDDFAWSYGAGAGIDFDFYRVGSTRVGLHVGVQYLFGTEAEYLDPGRLAELDTDGTPGLSREELEPAINRSRTDLIVPQLGVSVRF